MAYLDVVGFLPAPAQPQPGFGQAADILEQSAFAYAVTTSIVVLEVVQEVFMQRPLNALSKCIGPWRRCPSFLSRDVKSPGHLRLASADADGCVVVWDVLTAAPIARMEDLPAAREVLRDYAARSVAEALPAGGWWVLLLMTTSLRSDRHGSGMQQWHINQHLQRRVVVYAAGSLLWRRELGNGSELFSHLAVDPLDCRQLCLCGSQGALAVLQLGSPLPDRAELKQYRVNTQSSDSSRLSGATPSSSSSLQAQFAVSRGLLLVLLPRELLLFDLDLGAPAASSPLPPGRSPFSHLLGAFGSGVCQGGGDEGGIDFAYCLHVDGGLSVWVRVPGELRFKLGSLTRLLPSPIKGAGSQTSIVMIKGALWRHHLAAEPSSGAVSAQAAASTAAITAQISSSLAALAGSAREAGPTRTGSAPVVAAATRGGQSPTLSGDCLLVMAVSADGRVWQWEAALPRYPPRSSLGLTGPKPSRSPGSGQASISAAAPAPVLPQLVDCADPAAADSEATASDALPLPAAEAGSCPPAEYVAVGAAGTASGHVEVFVLRQGLVTPVAVEVVTCQAVHREAVRGLRWLGCSPLLVSFSSEKGGGSGTWKNRCALTDVRTGRSLPFRDSVTSEAAALVGLRVSPSGVYVLLLFKGAPAELWATRQAAGEGGSPVGGWMTAVDGTAASGGNFSLSKPWRVRLVDLPFTAVEWMADEDTMCRGSFTVWTPWAAAVGEAEEDGMNAAGEKDEGDEGDEGCDAGEEEQGADSAATCTPEQAPAGKRVVHRRRGIRGHARAPSLALDRSLSMWASRTFSLSVSRQVAAAFAAAGDDLPEERLAFALADGRSGTLHVRGRKVTDGRPCRLGSGPGPQDLLPTALAALWPLVVLGDAAGQLLAWDVKEGHCSSLKTGQGLVVRIQLAPGAPPALTGAVEAALSGLAPSAGGGRAGGERGAGGGVERMRAAVLFASGAFGVYELDGAGRLRSPLVSPHMSSRVGAAVDIGWVALAGAAGAGTVLAVVLQDGSLALVDTAQPAARRHSFKARQALLRQVPAAGGVEPMMLCSFCLCVDGWDLKPLSLVLEAAAGISQDALLYLSSSTTEEDDEVRSELCKLLPRSAAATLAQIAAAAAANAVAAGQSTGAGRREAAGSTIRSVESSAADVALANHDETLGTLAKAKSSPLLKAASATADVLEAAEARQHQQVAWTGQKVASARVLTSSSQQGGQRDQRHVALPFGSGLLGMDFDQAFDGDLVKLLRRVAQLRGSGHLWHAGEWKAYSKAMASGQVAQRSSISSIGPGVTRRGPLRAVPGHVRCTSTGPPADKSSGPAVLLWDEKLVLADAQERLRWHEALSSQLFEAEDLLEMRLLEYVAAGDFAAAVTFLLGIPPERTVSYYRSTVCALALSAAASVQAQTHINTSNSSSSRHAQATTTLHLQAAKVISAHASTMGDNLLGVPLMCSTNQDADAVTILQDAGMWQYAATLVARCLSGTERAQALSRWAGYVLHSEGSVWRCAGLLASAGCLSAAVQVLRKAGLPDCAEAFVCACREADLLRPATTPTATPGWQQQQQQSNDDSKAPTGTNNVEEADDPFSSHVDDEDATAGADTQSHRLPVELFDLLGQRTKMMPSLSTFTGGRANSSAELASGYDQLKMVQNEYDTYLCTLLANL
eukprot:gene9224-9389_t